MRRNRLLVPHIPVRGEECVVRLQTTPLTLVDVPLVGKVCVYLREVVFLIEFVWI